MDSVRENGVTIPKYNNVRKPDSLFDDVTSVKLPVQYFSQKSSGGKFKFKNEICYTWMKHSDRYPSNKR